MLSTPPLFDPEDMPDDVLYELSLPIDDLASLEEPDQSEDYDES